MATASTFSIPFVDTPAFYSGTAQTNVVPSVYPVAINGRPYLIDMKSGRYVRSHEQRVRDSQDTSTAPGEARQGWRTLLNGTVQRRLVPSNG